MKPFTLWIPTTWRIAVKLNVNKTITHIYKDDCNSRGKLACTVFHNINSRGTLRIDGKLYYPK